MRCTLFSMTIAMFVLLFANVAAGQPEPDDGDLWLCVSAGGQLKLSPLGLDPAAAVIVLPPTAGLFHGWSANEPGFDDVEMDDAANDAFTFAPGGFIWLEVLALDPALLVWNTGFQQFPPGSAAPLGSTDGDVHMHLIWHINSQSAVFDDGRTFWRGTFRLIDTGATAYAPSAAFTLYFSRVGCITADVNDDAAVDFFDIDPFVLVLFEPGGATPQQRCAADTNRDGGLNFFDIDPFVAALFGD